MPEQTKDKIALTLERLLQHKDLDKITITLLVSECGISRQCFYYYFQDIFDVTQWMIRKKADDLLEKSLSMEHSQKVIASFVDFAFDNRKIISRLLAGKNRKFIEQTLVHSLRSCLQQLILLRASHVALYLTDLDATLKFCTYGLTGLLLEQTEKKQVSKDTLVQQMTHLLTRLLANPASCQPTMPPPDSANI